MWWYTTYRSGSLELRALEGAWSSQEVEPEGVSQVHETVPGGVQGWRGEAARGGIRISVGVRGCGWVRGGSGGMFVCVRVCVRVCV
jgi:hypothetical protein